MSNYCKVHAGALLDYEGHCVLCDGGYPKSPSPAVGSSREKYKMFLNFLHNELGITKEDIREWTREAIHSVATEYVQHHFSEYELDRVAQRALSNGAFFNYGSLVKDVGDRIAQRLEVSIKEADNGSVPEKIGGTD